MDGSLDGGWAVQAQITNSGVLNLAGEVTLPKIENPLNGTGTVLLSSILDLEGETLDVNDSFGELVLDGGFSVNTIRGGITNGTLNITGSGNVNAIVAVYSGYLENVTVEGEMRLTNPGTWLHIDNGLTLNGTIRLQGAGGALAFVGDETINGSGSIIFDTTEGNRTDLLTFKEAGTVTIGSGITLEGGRATFGRNTGFPMSLVNQGTIRANVADESIIIEVANGSFDNQGTLEELNGGTIVLP